MSEHPVAAAARRRGVSQAKLARLTGVDQSTISRVFRGADGRRRCFSPEAAQALWPVVKGWGVSKESLVLPPAARFR
jgi:transcriptional regulator with XRE-family HTH domain